MTEPLLHLPNEQAVDLIQAVFAGRQPGLEAQLREANNRTERAERGWEAAQRRIAELLKERDKEQEARFEAEGRLQQVRMVKSWRNEDGRWFVFTDDLFAATDPDLAKLVADARSGIGGSPANDQVPAEVVDAAEQLLPHDLRQAAADKRVLDAADALHDAFTSMRGMGAVLTEFHGAVTARRALGHTAPASCPFPDREIKTCSGCAQTWPCAAAQKLSNQELFAVGRAHEARWAQGHAAPAEGWKADHRPELLAVTDLAPRYPHAHCGVKPRHFVHVWGDPKRYCDGGFFDEPADGSGEGQETRA